MFAALVPSYLPRNDLNNLLGKYPNYLYNEM